MQRIKLIAVGDRGVGKTYMLLSFTMDHVYENVLQVEDIPCGGILVDEKPVYLDFRDSSCQKEHDHLRPLSYPETDVFFVCFSVENRNSLENIDDKWIPEVNNFYPDVLKILVACKIDLRTSVQDAVTYDEGSAVAKKLGMKYCETSAFTKAGTKECLDGAVRSVLSARNPQKKKGLFGFGRKNRVIPPPPVMPFKGCAPKIEIETPTFGNDWYSMLKNPKHCDVTFILEGKHDHDAHTIILCSASNVFAKVFGVSKHITNNQMGEINDIENYTHEHLNSGLVPGIAAVYPKDTGDQGQTEGPTQGQTEGQHMCVEISADISEKTFVRVLEFLYSGVPRFPDVEKITEDELTALDKAAKMFQLSELQTICSNIQTDQAILNLSIGTCVNVETGRQMKKLLFNKETRADVVFTVDGKTVYGHKCILSARCEVFAAMFGGQFAEGKNNTISEINIPNTSSEVFLAVLEYIYTDHCPLEDADAVGIIMLADEYGMKRLLNLCELYISNEVKKKFPEKINKSEIDVIGLLLTSQNFNATHLASWCLFFISKNYIAFKQKKEFPQLIGDNKTHVEKNRWPPINYLNKVEEYNRQYDDKEDNKQCVVM